MPDAFELNIEGARNLVDSKINKTFVDGNADPIGELTDILDLPMTDTELLELKREWQSKNDGYYPKIKVRQDNNKLYYLGHQNMSAGQGNKVVASNLLFEAEETFIPQALSKNPEPVVWSDNTEEGKQASTQIKTMLQYHADVLCLRKKLAVMLRQWSIYFVGVIKHGWDEKTNDIITDLRKPQNFIWDPDGYVDEMGAYCGSFLGEKIEVTAEKLCDMFPDSATAIRLKVDGKMGTLCMYIEWWTDDYSFCTFGEIVLDKHKNPFFNYDEKEKATDEEIESGMESETVTPGKNHFSCPKMPYTFLSIFSLQEQPHDITNLIEQNVPNQDDINTTETQISRNVNSSNNAVIFDDKYFNVETARQGVEALNNTFVSAILGNTEGVKRLPASPLPSGLFENLQIKKDTLRSVFGTQGLTATNQDEEQTARGMILNESHDSTRIGGQVGDALEQVADNIFNWWLQLYYVFYDEAHYAAILGIGKAVEYTVLQKTDINRHFVISITPGSMKPKDEVSEMNMAIDLWNKKALDPITLFQRLDFPDPVETAKKVATWITNPMLYMQMYFPQQQQPMQDSANPPNPNDLNPVQGQPQPTLSAPPASPALNQVPLETPSQPTV